MTSYLLLQVTAVIQEHLPTLLETKEAQNDLEEVVRDMSARKSVIAARLGADVSLEQFVASRVPGTDQANDMSTNVVYLMSRVDDIVMSVLKCSRCAAEDVQALVAKKRDEHADNTFKCLWALVEVMYMAHQE